MRNELKTIFYLSQADTQRSIYLFHWLLVSGPICPSVWILISKIRTARILRMYRKDQQNQQQEAAFGRGHVRAILHFTSVEDVQVDCVRVQIDVTEIKSWTAQNTIIHKGKMASVKGTWIWADLDFELTTPCPPFLMFIFHRLKCLSLPSKKTHKEAVKQSSQAWKNAPPLWKSSKVKLGLRGYFCLCSQALIRLLRLNLCMHPNNSVLSKQTCVTCKVQTLNTRNFSLKVTPRLGRALRWKLWGLDNAQISHDFGCKFFIFFCS